MLYLEIDRCCAIVVAAGASTRMGTPFSKQFVPLLGTPAIVRTLFAFEQAESIQSVIVVCRAEDKKKVQELIRTHKIKKVATVVMGSDTRQKSVAAGVHAAPEDTAYFAIHDGARALITAEKIDSVVRDAVQHRASALAVPVKDTIKLVDEKGFVFATPNRSTLWAVQTPQVFEKELYLKALRRAEEDGADYTDDCQLVEHINVRVHLCMGSYANLKLTTVEDVVSMEAILKRREGQI